MAKPSAEIRIDDREFRRELKKYMEATRKDVPTVLNHTAGQAAFRAFRWTPAAPMSSEGLSAAYDPVAKRKWKPYRKGGKDPARLYYALAVMAGAKSGGRAEAARTRYRRRRSSSGFIRAQWRSGAKTFGVKGTFKPVMNPDMQAHRATIGRHIAEIWNAKIEGPGQGKAKAKLMSPWNRAIHDAVWGKNGMVEYAHRKLKERWKR